MAAVYVLHLHPPFKHARHYIGFTDGEDVAERLREHERGAGSAMLRAACRAGVQLEIAHVFVGGDRHFERRLKNRRDVCSWCRICGRSAEDHEVRRPTPRMGAGNGKA